MSSKAITLLIKIQEKNPSATEYAIMATRNAEHYYEFNNIFLDEKDDETQIIQIIEKQKAIENRKATIILEKEREQKEQLAQLDEQNKKNAESVSELRKQLNDQNEQIVVANETQQLLTKQLKESNIKRFIVEAKPEIKRIRWRSYSWKILGSILSFAFAFLMGFDTFCDVHISLKIIISILAAGVIAYTIASIVRSDDSQVIKRAIEKCENKILTDCNLTKEDILPYENDYK